MSIATSAISSAATHWDRCERESQGVLWASMGQRTAAAKRGSTVGEAYERALSDFLFALSVKRGLLMVIIVSAGGAAANDERADGAA